MEREGERERERERETGGKERKQQIWRGCGERVEEGQAWKVTVIVIVIVVVIAIVIAIATVIVIVVVIVAVMVTVTTERVQDCFRPPCGQISHQEADFQEVCVLSCYMLCTTLL